MAGASPAATEGAWRSGRLEARVSRPLLLFPTPWWQKSL